MYPQAPYAPRPVYAYAPPPPARATAEPPPVVWVLVSMGLMALLGGLASTAGAAIGLVALAN